MGPLVQSTSNKGQIVAHMKPGLHAYSEMIAFRFHRVRAVLLHVLRNGTVALVMGHLCLSYLVKDGQAFNVKGSSTCPLRHDLPILKPFGIHQVQQTITSYTKNQKWDTPGIRNGTLFSLQCWSYQLQTKVEVYVAPLIGDQQMQNKTIRFQCCREQSLHLNVPKAPEIGHFTHELDKSV